MVTMIIKARRAAHETTHRGSSAVAHEDHEMTTGRSSENPGVGGRNMSMR